VGGIDVNSKDIVRKLGVLWHGEFQKRFIFFARGTKQMSRPYVPPSQPRTFSQQFKRMLFAWAVYQWQQADQETKDFYRAEVKRRRLQMSGYNLFIHEKMFEELPQMVKNIYMGSVLVGDGETIITIPAIAVNRSVLLYNNFLCSPGEEVVYSNLLSNGGFESGDKTGWQDVGDPAYQIVVTERVRAGLYSLKLADLTTDFTERSVRSENIAVVPGKMYSFGAYLFLPYIDEDVGNYSFRIRIEWRDSDGAVIDSYPGVQGFSLNYFDVWEQKVWENVQAPSGAAYASLLIEAKRANPSVALNSVYIDDCFISPPGQVVSKVYGILSAEIVDETHIKVVASVPTGYANLDFAWQIVEFI